MHILLNLSNLKSGGGHNVAYNFLLSLDDFESNVTFTYYVASDSPLHHFLLRKKVSHLYVAPRNPLLRLLIDLSIGSFLLAFSDIDIIYTYFGFSPFITFKPQVSGIADSNLFYPDINFWNRFTGLSLFGKRLVDFYRLAGLKLAYATIFENPSLMTRAIDLYGISRTTTIKPSIYALPSCQSPSTSILKLPSGPKGLFLCGWQYHKNYLMIPSIASELKDQNIDFTFVFTAPLDQSYCHKEFVALAAQLNVSDRIIFTGPVPKHELPELYSSVDFVFLLSLLESFSNNIIEAWFYGKPLFITDHEWSRSICHDAAVYVSRDDPSSIADNIRQLLFDQCIRDLIVSRGHKMLSSYPSIHTRTRLELEFLSSCLKYT